MSGKAVWQVNLFKPFHVCLFLCVLQFISATCFMFSLWKDFQLIYLWGNICKTCRESSQMWFVATACELVRKVPQKLVQHIIFICSTSLLLVVMSRPFMDLLCCWTIDDQIALISMNYNVKRKCEISYFQWFMINVTF